MFLSYMLEGIIFHYRENFIPIILDICQYKIGKLELAKIGKMKLAKIGKKFVYTYI